MAGSAGEYENTHHYLALYLTQLAHALKAHVVQQEQFPNKVKPHYMNSANFILALLLDFTQIIIRIERVVGDEKQTNPRFHKRKTNCISVACLATLFS